MTLALGLDLGASGIRAYQSLESQAVVEISSGPTSKDRESDTIALIGQVANQLGDSRFSSVALGMSGFSSLDVKPETIADAIIRDFGATSAVVTSDMVSSHYAHFENEDGVIAVIGTGALAFGIGSNSHHRVDGLGASLGDYGSAHWIGLRALRESKRQSELHGHSQLLQALESEIGASTTWPKRLGAGELITFEIAKLAKVVDRVGRMGDQLAIEILSMAARHAAESVISCARKTGNNLVAYGGGVMAQEDSIAVLAFQDQLREEDIRFEVMGAVPGAGALKIASANNCPRVEYLVEAGLAFRKVVAQ